MIVSTSSSRIPNTACKKCGAAWGISLSSGGQTYRARRPEVLSEALAGVDGGQGAGLASAVGEGLDIDGRLAAVDDDGLLGGGEAEDGGDGEDGGLHFEG